MRLLLLSIVLLLSFLARDTATAADDQPLLIGITNLGNVSSLAAVARIKFVIDGPMAVAVDGDPFAIGRLPFVRYVHADPPDAVSIQDQALPWGVDKIDAEQTWGINRGTGIKIAILDTGIDCTHEDLIPDCNYGADFIDGGLPVDDHGHGTHVAGSAAGRDNAVGYIGVAPEASLWAVKVLNSGSFGSWGGVAAGIDWARLNGMQIISMSLGGGDFDQTVSDAVALAHSQGVLIISAAGNSGGCSTCDTVGYPARYPGSMAVAATDINDLRASFSSTGLEVDVAAPGVDVPSSVPTGLCSLCDPSGYRSLSGTSMATPHVSGLAALLLARGFTMQQTWDQLEATALDLGVAGFDWLYGYGRIQALAAMTNPPMVPAPKVPSPVPSPTPITSPTVVPTVTPVPPSPTPTPIVTPTVTPIPSVTPTATPVPYVRWITPLDGQIVPRAANILLEATGSGTVAISDERGRFICYDRCFWRTPGKPNSAFGLTANLADGTGATITVYTANNR